MLNCQYTCIQHSRLPQKKKEFTKNNLLIFKQITAKGKLYPILQMIKRTGSKTALLSISGRSSEGGAEVCSQKQKLSKEFSSSIVASALLQHRCSSMYSKADVNFSAFLFTLPLARSYFCSHQCAPKVNTIIQFQALICL